MVSHGQYIQLCHNNKDAHLYFNIDRVWSYNLYEHSRWGGGLLYTRNYRQGTHRFSAEGYYGYGVEDRKSKWGLTLDWMRTGSHERHIYLSAAYDLTAAGSRSMESLHLVDFTRNAAFMNRRMSHTERVAIGWRKQVSNTLTINIECRYSAEQRLYDGNGLLYPASYYRSGQKTLYSYPELTLGASWRWGLQAMLLAGSTEESNSCMPHSYLRALVQYNKTFDISPLSLNIFAQTGWCDGLDHQVPYSRMFDLGGTWGAPLLFEHSLLTARPNEFTANAFALLSLRLGTRHPLWRWWWGFAQIGSNPRPFVAVNAAWGHLWGQDGDGRRMWQGLDLQAPYMGIVESAVGIDGLVRWGAVDWGLAVAYRLTPTQAAYALDRTQDNLALLFTASLIF